MTDYNFIKEFSKIKLTTICKKFNINVGNVCSGVASDENLKKVKNEILNELLKLFVEDNRENLITIFLYNELLQKLEKENKMLREMI